MQIAILSFFHYFTLMFKKRESIFEVEEGKFLAPKFGKDGLMPVTTTDSKSGEVLMQGYMNNEALKKTIETKEAHYWSRSRNALWQKGKISGFIQKVIDLRIDDDQDALWMTVDIGNGASCHVGYKSCFFRSITLGPIKNIEEIELEFKEREKKFDPEKIYEGQSNPTKL
jgi:phosphoribosyl-AMP cyclohydrolase